MAIYTLGNCHSLSSSRPKAHVLSCILVNRDSYVVMVMWSTAASASAVEYIEFLASRQHHNKFATTNLATILPVQTLTDQIASCIIMVWGIPQHMYPRKSASQQIPSVSSPTNPCLCHSEPTMLATGNTTPSRCTEAFTHSMVPPTLLSCNTKKTSCCAQDLHNTRCPSASGQKMLRFCMSNRTSSCAQALHKTRCPSANCAKLLSHLCYQKNIMLTCTRPTCRLCCKLRKNAVSSLNAAVTTPEVGCNTACHGKSMSITVALNAQL